MKNKLSIHLIIISFAISILSCSKDDVINYIILENFEQEIVDLINDYRDSTGLSELAVDTVSRREARIHSINIATGKTTFGHDGYQERADIIFSATGGTHFGENVAEGNYPTADYFIENWLNSPTHKENIDGDYNYTGVGVAETKNGSKFCTQIFLKK